MLCLSPFQQSVIRFSGDLDIATRASTERKLREVDTDVAIIDLSGVTFLDAGALGSFVGLKKRLRARGRLGIVRVVAPNPRFRRLFQITGLTKILEICESLSGAQAARA